MGVFTKIVQLKVRTILYTPEFHNEKVAPLCEILDVTLTWMLW